MGWKFHIVTSLAPFTGVSNTHHLYREIKLMNLNEPYEHRTFLRQNYPCGQQQKYIMHGAEDQNYGSTVN